MIPVEMKNNLHCDDVRGDGLPLPHDTNTNCSVVNKRKKVAFENKEYTTD